MSFEKLPFLLQAGVTPSVAIVPIVTQSVALGIAVVCALLGGFLCAAMSYMSALTSQEDAAVRVLRGFIGLLAGISFGIGITLASTTIELVANNHVLLPLIALTGSISGYYIAQRLFAGMALRMVLKRTGDIEEIEK